MLGVSLKNRSFTHDLYAFCKILIDIRAFCAARREYVKGFVFVPLL